MSKGLVLNIDLAGENISGFVESLRFEDSTEKDNTLTISIKEGLVLVFLENQNLVAGAEIVFSFGYIGGPLSIAHKAVVSNIDVSYADGVKATITALDVGHFANKNHSKTIWGDITASGIASVIADKYGLKRTITTTTKKYDSMPQGGRSDFQLLKDLALKENNFIFYVTGTELFFGERGLAKDSVLTYSYGESNVISFRPTTKLTKSEGISENAEITSFTAEAQVETTVTVNNETEENVTTTTGVFINSDIGLFAGEKKLVKATDDEEEAKNIANNAKKKDALGTQEAVLTVEGEPNISTNTIITINNVATRHRGNWLVVGITQTVGSGGFTTALQLKARGSKTGSTRAENTNRTTGGDQVENTKEVQTFKINSDLGLFAGPG